MSTLADSSQGVAFRLGNRPDLLVTDSAGNTRIDYWLRNAYINLIMSNRFSGTEGSSSFTLVAGQDTYSYPTSARAIETLTLYKADGTIVTVETKDIKYIRRMNNVNQAVPSVWCEFGSSIIFRPVPDGNGPYTCQLDLWLLPVIGSPINTTVNNLPLDWMEVLEYAAALRGHVDLQEEDKARSIQTYLYGYTDPSGKYTPGIVQNLQTRQQASAPFKDYGLQPKGMTIRYTGR